MLFNWLVGGWAARADRTDTLYAVTVNVHEMLDRLNAQIMIAILRSVSRLTGWVVVVLQDVDSMCHYLMLFDEK